MSNAAEILPTAAAPPVATDRVTLASLLRPAWTALGRYWRPFALLQACALGLVIAYYNLPWARTVCGYLAELKGAWGFAFSACAGAVAGVVLPQIAKALAASRTGAPRLIPGDLFFKLLLFAGIGIITDYQYRFFSLLFGPDPSFPTAVKKMLFDQFITTPVYGIPYFPILFLWRENNFRLRPTVRELTPRWYLTRVMPLLIPCWAYWCPMTLMVYSLPATLQISLFSFALAAWSLILVFVATEGRSAN